MRRRLLTSLVIVAAALGTSACGNKESEILHGATEGSYLDLGGMKYQVQISRQLNPASVEDRYYLIGLSPQDRNLPAGQEWFALFIRVENDGEKAARAATDYTITDTQDNKYRPLRFAPDNVFAFRGGTLQLHLPDAVGLQSSPMAFADLRDEPNGRKSVPAFLLTAHLPG